MRVHVEPGTVVNVLSAADVPQSFAVVSVDVDGNDYFLLDAIVNHYWPPAACVETNEKIPPPVKFTVLHRADPRSLGPLLRPEHQPTRDAHRSRHGYYLIGLEYSKCFPRALRAQHRARLSADEASRAGYRYRPDQLTRFPLNRDMEALLDPASSEAVAAIHSKFAD